MRDTLTVADFMGALLDINKGRRNGRLTKAERLTAGFVGAGVELMSMPDGDILPFLPQIVQRALSLLHDVHVGAIPGMLRAFEQETGHAFANFEALTDTDLAYEKSLLLVENVVSAATRNEGVAMEVKAALRANRYMAERFIMEYCYSTAGHQLLQLADVTHRAGQFGNVLVQSGRDDDGDVLVRFTLNNEQVFEFAWNGFACTLGFALGNITPEIIDDTLGRVLDYWSPEGFIQV